jgi:hypothetical protein
VRLLHWAALACWVASGLAAQVLWWTRPRTGGDQARRRTLLAVSRVQHIAFAALLLGGGVLFLQASPALAHARVLHLKLGLTAFLLLPLEAFHAYVCAAWIGPGLKAGGRARDLERGLGLDDMVRSLQIPLFGLAVPLLVWLSLQLRALYI